MVYPDPNSNNFLNLTNFTPINQLNRWCCLLSAVVDNMKLSQFIIIKKSYLLLIHLPHSLIGQELHLSVP